jgi:hypothetical protein
MDVSLNLTIRWSKVGIAAGLLASIIYPTLLLARLPIQATLVLAASFGPLLSVASIGLYKFLSLHKQTVSLQIGVIANIIAGTVVNLLLVVQLAAGEFLRLGLESAADLEAESLLRIAYSAADKVRLGFDISWDVYISVGTILFAVNMLHHPRFGRLIAAVGVGIGVSLLALNFFTFPVPPAEANSLDLGPFVGLWYFVVTILLARSLHWLQNFTIAEK